MTQPGHRTLLATSADAERRRFLGSAAAAIAAPWVVPAAALGRSSGRPAPSERITIGLIGCGGMGRANLNSFMRKPDVTVLAVCDPDRSRRESTRRDVESHYAASSTDGTYAGCTDYNDYRELLDRPDIDAVIVGSPDNWHALQVVHAARRGKDIYGEKPLSLTVQEGRAMSDAVRRNARVFQTGSQQRSDARFRLACEIVRNGRLGRLERVTCGLPAGERTGTHPPIPVPDGFDYDMWLGPAPWAPYCDQRTHYVFRHILDYSGGKLTDWGAHHIDIAQWALGTMNTGPTSVTGTGTFPEDGLWNAAVDYEIRAQYPDGPELLITSAAPNGVRFEGRRGWLFVTRGRIEAEHPELLQDPFTDSDVRLPVSTDHHRNFLDCMRSRKEPVAPIEQAHRTITIAHLGNIAMQVGRPINWNPGTELIVGDESASRMLGRTVRSPWAM